MLRLVRKVSICLVVAVVVSCFPGGSPERKKARHLNKGEACLAESTPREAIIEFGNSLKMYPTDAAACPELGLA